MRKWKLCAASLFALAASSCTSSETEAVAPSALTPASAPSTLAFDDDAVLLLSSPRKASYGDLASESVTPPQLVVDRASKAAVSIALDLPALAGTPRDSALVFVKRWQLVLDDRVSYTEYQVTDSAPGCDGAVVTLDRFIGGLQVIGSRLTLHFDARGHLLFVTNGVAPVPSTVLSVDPTVLPGALPLEKVIGPKNDQKALPRVPVLAPLPDGSGLHHADLVSFVAPDGKVRSTIAVGTTAITGALAGKSDGRPRPSVLPDVRIEPGERVPSYVRYANGLPIDGLPIERNPVERAFRYLETHATVFHTGEARCQFTPRFVTEAADGIHVRLDQRHATKRVFGADLTFTFDGDKLTSILGHTLDNLDLELVPVLDAAAAKAVTDSTLAAARSSSPAWKELIDRSVAGPVTTELGILPRWAVSPGVQTSVKDDRLAWRVQRGNFTFYVDAKNGVIRSADSGVQGSVVVNDAGGNSVLAYPFFTRESTDGMHVPGAPFNVDTTPGRIGGSTAASLQLASDTFMQLGWRGQNGRGSDFIASTNVDLTFTSCPNAFYDWILTNSAFFCLGVASNDVVAHEITHGVIASSTGVTYQNESGAVNEAFADVMGNTIFREPGGGWIIGENNTTGAFRDMSSPAHMSGYMHRDSSCDALPWSCDFGFVHTNSAIINKAHQMLADGIPNAIGRDKLMLLAFTTMTQRLPSNARFNDVPLAERDVCERFVARGVRDLTGVPFTSDDCNAIETAFSTVGLIAGLSSGWAEPTLGFEGTRTWFPTDTVPGGCLVRNVEAKLNQLWDTETADMDPTTPLPSTVQFLGGVSSLSIVIPPTAPGTRPFPLDTPFKRVTTRWTSIYGVEPSSYVTVIPSTTCPPLVRQSATSDTFSESNPFGGGSTVTLGDASSTISPACTLDGSELEMLDGDGNTIAQGQTPTSELVVWFLFVPVHFDMHARVLTSPGASSPTDLSGRFAHDYALGRTMRIRWRYHFTASAGVTCTP